MLLFNTIKRYIITLHEQLFGALKGIAAMNKTKTEIINLIINSANPEQAILKFAEIIEYLKHRQASEVPSSALPSQENQTLQVLL